MSLPLGEEELLADFDRRCNRGTIFYDSNPTIQTQTIDGFQYEFAITGAIGKKPFIKDNADEPPPVSKSPSAAKRSPGYVPGSDIDVSGYEIAHVNGGSHLLMFNKFCMYRPHLLLLTRDGYRRQYEQLDLQDLQAVWDVLQSLDWRYFMFFNCGKDGGCSRLHKHVQLAPYLKDRLAPWPETTKELPNAPYEYILRRFEGHVGPKEVLEVYEQMLAKLKSHLGLDDLSSSEHFPHNVALGRHWIIVIPRRSPGVGGAYGNTLSMLGMISVATDEELKCWLSQGPRHVQSQLGVPRGALKEVTPQVHPQHLGCPIISHAKGYLVGAQDGLKVQHEGVAR